jgi:diazepam-binding inhibitor (GABA receptor modulating acyl-CoA-binding protein)
MSRVNRFDRHTAVVGGRHIDAVATVVRLVVIMGQFENAVKIINEKPAPGAKAPKLDVKKKLTFYALYKQATEGKCTQKEPSKMDMAAHYKWKAWTQCGDMSKEDAKKKYVELAKSVLPDDIKSKL